MKNIIPVYHGKRRFLKLKDLVISFYTQKCQFHCSFCILPFKSSDSEVSVKDVIKQIDWVFDRYKDEIETFQQFSVGNEGSILDRKRFQKEAIDYLVDRARDISALEVLSLETRAEYLKEPALEDILKKTNAKVVDVTIGFETQDDRLRNEVLNKKINKRFFEKKIKLLGNMGIRLTSYVMLKPAPLMTEEEGINEAMATVEYLAEQCQQSNTSLVIYLNPTYVAKDSPLAKVMKGVGYKPPKIQSVLKTVLGIQRLSIPVYTGLWCENLADETGDFSGRENYDSKFRDAINQFNKTQDFSTLKSLGYGGS